MTYCKMYSTAEHFFSTQGLSAFQPWHIDPAERKISKEHLSNATGSHQPPAKHKLPLSHDLVDPSVSEFSHCTMSLERLTFQYPS